MGITTVTVEVGIGEETGLQITITVHQGHIINMDVMDHQTVMDQVQGHQEEGALLVKVPLDLTVLEDLEAALEASEVHKGHHDHPSSPVDLQEDQEGLQAQVDHQ